MIARNPYWVRARRLFCLIIRRDIFHNPAVTLIFRPDKIWNDRTISKHGSDNVTVVADAPNNFEHIDSPIVGIIAR